MDDFSCFDREVLEDYEAVLWKERQFSQQTRMNTEIVYQKLIKSLLRIEAKDSIEYSKTMRTASDYSRKSVAKVCQSLGFGKYAVVLQIPPAAQYIVPMSKYQMMDYSEFLACVQHVIPGFNKVKNFSWLHWARARVQALSFPDDIETSGLDLLATAAIACEIRDEENE